VVLAVRSNTACTPRQSIFRSDLEGLSPSPYSSPTSRSLGGGRFRPDSKSPDSASRYLSIYHTPCNSRFVRQGSWNSALSAIGFTQSTHQKNHSLRRLHPEDDMPQILQHSPTMWIIQLSRYQPLPHLYIILQRSLVDLLTADSELRAARREYRHPRVLVPPRVVETRRQVDGAGTSRHAVEYWCRCLVHQLIPDLACDVAVDALRVPLVAARIPVAAEVDIAIRSHSVEVEEAHGDDVVVQWGVDMPRLEKALAVGVEEGHDRGNFAVVVVDNVGEVGHCFMAFVHRRYEGVGSEVRTGGVDDVDGSLPAAWIGSALCDGGKFGVACILREFLCNPRHVC
jgi:hypothetical protein